MSFDEWINQGSPKALAAAIATAVFAGLGAGAWVSLPDYLAEPVSRAEPRPIDAIDPGREKWNQIVASLGGVSATFVIPASLRSEPAPEPEFLPELEDRMALASAEIEAELRDAERRAQQVRMEWEARRYAYAEPVRYAEPPRYAPRQDIQYAPAQTPQHAQRYESAYAHAVSYPHETRFPHERIDEPAPARGLDEEPAPPPPPAPSAAW